MKPWSTGLRGTVPPAAQAFLTTASTSSRLSQDRHSNTSVLFVAQVMDELNQFIEEGIDVHTAVVCLDELLELLHQVSPGLVQLDHLGQFLADGTTELFRFRVFSPLLEMFFEGIKVNLAEVN